MAATIGKVTFDGKNLTEAPYHAHLTTEAKYWFLDGFESMQIPVDPQRLISTQSYLKSWIINAVFRVEPPEPTRKAMLTALASLASLLDPTRGEKKLIFDEFPYSYFIAKGQTFALANEATIPYMVDVPVAFACTGPSYSNVETVVNTTIASTTDFIITSDGNAIASPRYRITPGAAYSGDVTLTNDTTNESLTWKGSLQTNDVLDIIIDAEYGTPYSVFKNGAVAMDNLTGPVWPRIIGGDNTFTLTGPASGKIETRWRDRYLVGQTGSKLASQIYMTPNITTPTLGQTVTFTVHLTGDGLPMSRQVIIYHYLGEGKTTNYTGTTDTNGVLTNTATITTPGSRVYFAEFLGDASYDASISSASTVNTTATTMVGFAVNDNTVYVGDYPVFWGTLQWRNTQTNAWVRVALIKPIHIWHTTPAGATSDDGYYYTDNTGAFGFPMGPMNSSGSYVYHAEYGGDVAYLASNATPITITVSAL